MTDVYSPEVQLILLKNVVNDNGLSSRYKGGENRIDLTDFLGENGHVHTNKGILGAAVGSFSIVLTFKAKDTQDSIYTSISPMDMIDIRMARSPHEYAGNLPIIMRGFVTSIQRSEIMSDDGRPYRTVNVSGYDIGKVLHDYKVFMMRFSVAGINLSGTTAFLQKTGLEDSSVPVGFYMLTLLDKIINPYLAQMFKLRSRSDGETPLMIGSTITDMPGNVFVQGIPNGDFTIWDIMLRYSDQAWNELFVEDQEERPTLIFRKKPYKDYETGKFILGSSTESVSIEAAEIQSITAERSDRNVANIFWVDSSMFYGMKSVDLRADVLSNNDGTVLHEGYPNNNPKLYADRYLSAQSNLSTYGHGFRNLPEDDFLEAEVSLADWSKKRRLELRDLNKDNSVFENGSLVIRGNERVRAGKYLSVNRGELVSDYYVNTVSHHFIPFRSYKTTVEYSRGTNFRDRSRLGQSPYYGEYGENL